MSDNLLVKVFDDKSISDILRDIYNNHHKTEGDLNKNIEIINKAISNSDTGGGSVDPGVVSLLGPVLTNQIELKVKNNDNLVKLVNVASKYVISKTDTNNYIHILSDEEKKDIISLVEDQNKLNVSTSFTLDDLGPKKEIEKDERLTNI